MEQAFVANIYSNGIVDKYREEELIPCTQAINKKQQNK